MSKWVGDISKSIIAGLLLLGVPALVAWLAWIQYLPYFIIALGVIAALGLVLFTRNQWLIYRRERGKRLSKLSSKEIEKAIRDWIEIPGFSVEKKKSEPETYFNYLIQDKGGRSILIRRTTMSPQIITLAMELDLSRNFAPADPAEWDKLARKIRIELARLGIQYKFDGDPKKLTHISLQEPVILEDSLGEFLFRQRVVFIIRAFVLVNEMSKQASETT